MTSTEPRYIDDIDQAAYVQYVDELADTLHLDELIVLDAIATGAIAGDVWVSVYGVSRLQTPDLDTIAHLAVAGLIVRGRVTELGGDVLAAARARQ